MNKTEYPVLSLFDRIFLGTTNDVWVENLCCLNDKKCGDREFKELFDYAAASKILENQSNPLLLNQLRTSSLNSNNYDLFKVFKSYVDASTKYLNKGVFKSKYTCKGIGFGRQYSKGCQGITREFRSTIMYDYYYDIDLCNCHPTILYNLCLFFEIDCEHLKCYVNNRDSIMDECIIHNPDMSKDDVKQMIIGILYGQSTVYKKINKYFFIEELYNEIEKNTELFCEMFGDFYNQIKTYNINKNKDYNHKGSCLSSLLQIIENELLMTIYKYLTTKLNKKDLESLCFIFDGIHIPKTVHFDLIKEKFIPELEQIFINIDCPMKLKIKEFVPLDFKNGGVGVEFDFYKEQKLFSFQDKYYIGDFINDIIGMDKNKKKIWNSFEELLNFAFENINRVYIRLLNHDSGLFVKINDDNPLTINKIPSFNVYYNSLDKFNKPIVIHKKLCALIENEFYNFIKFYDDLECKPYDIYHNDQPKLRHDRNFNTFSGFKAKLLDRDLFMSSQPKIQMILDHWFEVLADSNEDYYKYQLTFFHNLIRNPNKKNKIFMLFKSIKQQIGKGTIMIEFLMKKVFGEGICLKADTIESLTKRFNAHLMNKILFIADEVDTVTDTKHSTFNQLKGLITESIMEIEIKNGKVFNFDNCLNGIGLTNKQWSIPLEQGDVRYAVFNCNPKYSLNTSYFDKLYKQFNDENADIFFSYLYYYETDIDLKQIPNTEIKRELVNLSNNSTVTFINDVKEFYIQITDNDLNENENEWNRELQYNIKKDAKKIKQTVLYKIYETYCKITNKKNITSFKIFKINVEHLLKSSNHKNIKYYKLIQ